MEVIIIRKLLSLFLVLVVITSLSFTAFAVGEQPSGSAYQYYIGNTTLSYDTFWVAISKGLVYIGQQTKLMNGYLSTANNYYQYIRNDLADIKLAIDPTSSSSNFQTPYGSSYSYYTFQDSTSLTNFWNAVNNQLQYLSNRVNSIYSTASSIDTRLSTFDTYLLNIRSYLLGVRNAATSIDTSTQSIDSSTQSIDSKLPDGTFSYVGSDGTITSQSNSTRNFWSAMTVSTSYMAQDVNSINDKLPSGNLYWYLNTAGNWRQTDYWNAMANSNGNLEYWLFDLHTMFASPEDLALKADQENNISSATTNFLSGNDSATSVGTGSIGKVKDLGDDAATWFDTGVQATSLFDALSNTDNDGPWMWFTQATMDDLDSTTNSRSNQTRAVPGEYVPDFYGAKMDELRGMLDSVSEVDNRSIQNYVYTAADFPIQEVPDYVD